jgi:predicted ribosomally synthesized peptide with nif11-like leader
MTQSEAKRFLDELWKNEKLQQKVKKYVLAEQVMTAIAKDEGFSFTPDELDEELARRWGHQGALGEPLCKMTFSEAPGF